MNGLDVSFQNFKEPYLELKEDLDEAYHRFMESGMFVLGKETSAFEVEYAAYCQAAHCVGVANGLDALHLSLLAIGIVPGNEVIVPSNTYIATWLAVTHAGGIPVPVEPDPHTYNIDVTRIEQSISSKTRAILAVNLYGQPCDYDPILAIANKYGLKVIIDNAQAQGARYKGQRVGGIADIECHSFYPSKNLGAYGEAGAITTNNTKLADRIRVLRNYGSRTRYYNEIQGYNSRIDELQAAFLRVKLRHLDIWNTRRTEIADQYQNQLEGNSAHPECNLLVLPATLPWVTHVWHLFVIRHQKRDIIQKYLADQGIQTIIHYPIPPHLSEAYSRSRFKKGDFPIAENIASTALSLPIGPHLSLIDRQSVIKTLRRATLPL